ncbi:MAG: multiheme c-type cytochrome [Planctomycetota bacterium]
MRTLAVTILALGLATWLVAGDEQAKPIDAPGTELQIHFGVNNLGYIDVCGCKHKKVRQGSVTRRASYLSQVRGRGHNVALVDGGNTFFSDKHLRAKDHEKRELIEQSKVLVESMNRMGYHAMTVGHYDFLMGLDSLLALQKLAKFPFVCANLVDEKTGELLFQPTYEFEQGDVKVGVVGLMLSSVQPHYFNKRAPGYKVTDHIEAAKKHVWQLRSRNDVVLVLSHNTVEDNVRLAQEVKGIDFIVDPFLKDGHHKLWLEDNQLMQEEGTTLIARVDSQGARLGVIDLRVIKGGTPYVNRETTPVPEGRSSYQYRRVSIEPHLLEDPEIKLLVDSFKKASKTFIDTESLPPLPNKDKYLKASTCQACHPDQYAFWKKTKHGTAFASLEETGDQYRQECIGCHVLGYGQTFIAPEHAEPYKDVQCESCHGLNPEHPTNPAAHPWPRIKEASCLTCHNERQTRSKFVFPRERPKIACPKIKR